MYSLIKSWIAIEFLSASNEIDTNNNNTQVFIPENYEKTDFTGYKGYKIKTATFKSADMYNMLAEIFKDKSFADRNPFATSYTCEFEIDLKGTLNIDSIAISSLPWAVRQLQIGTSLNHWENTFQLFKEEVMEKICEIFKDTKKTVYEKVAETQLYLENKLEWQPGILNKTYFTPIKQTNTEKNDSLLNSFYTKDLTLLARESTTNWGKTLQNYLQQKENTKRINLLKNSDIIKNKLSARLIPEGAWPSLHNLSLMQQYAVNHIVNDLANTTGHFSVNGPPGTGKTTLLKDAIAAIIVKRAKALSTYKSPKDAFTVSKKYYKENGYETCCYKLDSKICDDAIIIASSNNAAVENISKELPKVDEKYVENNKYPENIYFKDIAQLISENSDVWNCCSFALGNSKNRATFSNIWEKWNDETKSFDKPFQEAINSLKYTLDDWERIKKEFKEQLNAFSQLKETLYNYEQLLLDSSIIELLKKYGNNTEDAGYTLTNKKEENAGRISLLTDKIKELELDFSRLRELKPMFWHFLFNTKPAKEYKNKVETTNNLIDSFRKEIQKINHENNSLNKQLVTLSKYKQIRDEYQQFTPDALFWADAFKSEKPSQAQELSPWFNKSLKTLSVSLFFKALELQTVFISVASWQIKSNISLLVSHFKRTTTNFSDEDLKNIWNTLFLLVPVISTTFSSVGSMFKNVNKESFGWLFIDESGQAIPQAAVGAINRCKRVVAVGDPLQIEPVVTLPEKVFDYIKKENSVSDNLFYTKSSVQTFFDKINPFGTFMNEGMWIGSPLIIHRRCTEPMFGIANEIAYDNIMQNANRDNPFPAIGNLYSQYIDVQGTCTNKQFVPEQAVHALRLIMDYYNSLSDKDKFSLYVISPFKAVEYEFKKEIKKLPYEIRNKLKGQIGTVHTFQGKEADVVLFLSGCDETKKGAIVWADSSPNLLNVALTRAKKIFIAIGDKKLYRNTRHFSKMIRELDKAKKDNTSPANYD